MRWLHAIAMWLLRVPPCTECGRCCAPGLWAMPWQDVREFVDIKRKDVERLKRSQRWMTSVRASASSSHNDHHMRLHVVNNVDQCVALQGQPGQRVGCSVYDRRPNTCRDWPRGGWRCLTVLSWSRNNPRPRGSDRFGLTRPWWAVWTLREWWWWRTNWARQWWRDSRRWGWLVVVAYVFAGGDGSEWMTKRVRSRIRLDRWRSKRSR